MSFRSASLMLAATLIITAMPPGAIAQEPKPRNLTLDDLFKLEAVSSPVVSPDGSQVAYVVGTLDLAGNSSKSAIWMVAVAGGEPRRMTGAESSASSPRFSPDGTRLAFKAKRGKDAKSQVWALNLGGGEAQQVTDVKQGVEDYEWSADSHSLALLIRDPEPERPKDKPRPPWVIDRLQFKHDYRGYLDHRRPHLYVFDLRSKKLRQLTSGDFDDSSPVWSPTGDRIAFVSNRTAEPDSNYNTDVWVIDADAPAGTEPTKISTGLSRDDSPAWAPDGATLSWLTSTRPEIHVYALQHLAIGASGSSPRVLTEASDRNVSQPRFAADGRSIVALLEREGAQHLVTVAVADGAIETLWGGERNVAAFAILPAGSAVAAVSTPGTPTELWVIDARKQVRQLTHHNVELLGQLQFGKVKKEAVKSPDGTQLEAFYTFPPGVTEPAGLPTILWIHGGPSSQDDWGWDAQRQLFAANGYLVVQPNYRASHGYGQEFALGHWRDWGGPERVDSIAAVDYAIARGWADPDRLGVGGWSYGGITTNAIITHTERFKAAVSGASDALWVAGYGHDEYQRWYEHELGLPWENRELWERISTYNRVDRITTPTLWIGGEKDWNVPIIQSEIMYQAMRRLGRETLLVVYPGQHHGSFPPVYAHDRYRRFLGWFGKYLLGDDSAWPDKD